VELSRNVDRAYSRSSRLKENGGHVTDAHVLTTSMLTTAPLNLHLLNVPNLPSSTDLYSDSRTHGYQGPTRLVRLPRATTNGGGAIAKSEDGLRCVVVGKECEHLLYRNKPPILDCICREHCESFGFTIRRNPLL